MQHLSSRDDLERAFPEYELGVELGQGAHGVVWSARHRQLDREVAIKQLLRAQADPEQFRHEARVVARFDHPHVVRVYDYRESGDLRLLVMELLPGGSLAQRVQRGLGTPEILDAGVAAAAGLAHAHSHEIVHGDVTPSNLLFDGRDTLKVVDFGVAWAAASAAPGTSDLYRPFGTPAFLSPEQAAAVLGSVGEDVTHLSDQYSLAASLYFSLTGRFTHDADGGPLALCRRRHELPAHPITSLTPAVPAAVADVLMRALARDPRERHRSSDEFGAALTDACGSGRTNTRTASPDFDGSRGSGDDRPRTIDGGLLIGREGDLAEIDALLGTFRVVSIVAAAGVGKTSLAKVVATRRSELHERVWFVDLTAVGGPADVPAAIARALEVQEEAASTALDAIADRMTDSTTLLVLDNCEHVVAVVAGMIDELVDRCPLLSVLVTSREPLHIDDEVVVRLPALQVPPVGGTVDELLASSSAVMFLERARRQHRELRVTVHDAAALETIVRRLQGNPLGLSLAAARTRSMSLEDIASRLDRRLRLLTTGDRSSDPRHRTLLSAIEWSYALLDVVEQRALRCAAVFVGGFDLRAGVAVLCGCADVDEFRAVDLIDALVDKSLVERRDDGAGCGRYVLLESIREFAADQLAADGGTTPDGVALAHLRHFTEVAVAEGRLLVGPSQLDANSRLRADHGNLMAALSAAAVLPGAASDGVRLAASLSNFWVRNAVAEPVVDIVQRLVALDLDPVSTCAAGVLLADTNCSLGDVAAARAAAELAIESSARADVDGTQLLWWRARRARALANLYAADPTAAMVDLDGILAGLAADRSVGDRNDVRVLVAETRSLRALALRQLGRTSEVKREYDEVARSYRACGDLLGLAGALANIADLALELGDLAAAVASLGEAVPLAVRLDSVLLSSLIEGNLGLVALRSGQPEAAQRHFVQAVLMSARGNDRPGMVNNLCGCASSIAAVEPHSAAILLAVVDAFGDRYRISPDPNEQLLREEAWAEVRSRLTDRELELALRDGARMTVRELTAGFERGLLDLLDVETTIRS
jgi:non-specific serine/threonine protein kinase